MNSDSTADRHQLEVATSASAPDGSLLAELSPRIALITYDDLTGSRWNGFDLLNSLTARGLDVVMFVLRKRSDHPKVIEVVRFRGRDRVTKVIQRLEERLSFQSVAYPWSLWLERHPLFQRSNIVHLHIYHMEYLSLPLLPRLVKGKRLVVTLHDAWSITGHCVYPAGCNRYKVGCGNCPDLDLPFAMRTDRTATMMNIKQSVWHKARAHFHVTTRYMEDLARNSTASQGLGCTCIPLGLDTRCFKPGDVQSARRALGLSGSPGLVVGLRATKSVWKGLPVALEAIREAARNIPITVITFQDKGLLDELKPHVEIIDLGWVTDEDALILAYQAMDVFLMLSSHESFGFMALEAMACGAVPIVFGGTTMHEFLDSEDIGYIVPPGDIHAASQALIAAYNASGDHERRAQAGRALAVSHFSHEEYHREMIKLYTRLL